MKRYTKRMSEMQGTVVVAWGDCEVPSLVGLPLYPCSEYDADSIDVAVPSLKYDEGARLERK